MASPYKVDPNRKTGQLQEEHLVTLKDDSTKPPPTVGTPSWMAILGGPALGQPGGRSDEAADRFLFSARFWLLLLIGLAVAVWLLRR